MYLHPEMVRALAAEHRADMLRLARSRDKPQRWRRRSIIRRSRLVGRPMDRSLVPAAAD